MAANGDGHRAPNERLTDADPPFSCFFENPLKTSYERSPRIHRASWLSFGIMVHLKKKLFGWNTQKRNKAETSPQLRQL